LIYAAWSRKLSEGGNLGRKHRKLDEDGDVSRFEWGKHRKLNISIYREFSDVIWMKINWKIEV